MILLRFYKYLNMFCWQIYLYNVISVKLLNGRSVIRGKLKVNFFRSSKSCTLTQHVSCSAWHLSKNFFTCYKLTCAEEVTPPGKYLCYKVKTLPPPNSLVSCILQCIHAIPAKFADGEKCGGQA